MSPWIRTALLLGLLAAVILAASRVSRAPTISGLARVKVPRLVRVAGGEPPIRAEAALALRLTTGEALYERNAGERLAIASLTKLMTALVAAELGRPLDPVTFSPAAKEIGDTDDKRSSAPAGEALRLEDVLKMLLISSDNDAAYALSEHAAPLVAPETSATLFQERIAAFVGRMNARARELGLEDTRFANPAGRDEPGNYSTARDLAKLAAAIAERHPELWALTRIQETFVFGAGGRRYGLVNTNPLLAEFPAIYGSKTGFDDGARGALLILYQIAPQDLAALVLLRSPDRFGDGRAFIRWVEESFVVESH